VKLSYLVGIAAFWLASIAYGFWDIREFESSPGAAMGAPSIWPSTSRIPAPRGETRVVIFVHPKCSCTRASLEELATLGARIPGPVSVWVVIEESQEVAFSSLPGASAINVLHVTETHDPQGVEARLFGALTSGHVVVYDSSGKLRFSGGITGARGHVGDNWGAKRLTNAVAHPELAATTHGVYGCPL